MARLLYLVHRLPYPPDKGDKVRSYHLLRHLSREHEVHLGTFVDDPQDLPHIRTLQAWCAGVNAQPLHPAWARVNSLQGLLQGQPLTLSYYQSAAMQAWVRRLAAQGRIDATVVFSSAMAPYALETPGLGPVLLDFVDLDSAKWAEYACRRRGPLAWIYAREGLRLADYERRAARRVYRSYFVSESERALFLQQAPDCADRVAPMGNGVDTGFFDPALPLHNPFEADEQALVFTGAMDYWPNEDAVVWFVREILPELRRQHPAVRLHIVGRGASATVQALASPAVSVTGAVPDVRPYQRHAALIVAPLRLARGIQNKVLEGMAMGRAVVAARSCVQALGLTAEEGIVAADDAADQVQAISGLLSEPGRIDDMGRRARQCVLARFSWDHHLRRLTDDLRACLEPQFSARSGPAWPEPAA